MKLTARIDISKASQAAELQLGDVVEIVIRGKVKNLRGIEEGMRDTLPSVEGSKGAKSKTEKYTYPGSVELELHNFKVVGGSDFSGMEDD